MIQLSQNFFLHEFLRSETAARRGIVIEATPEVVLSLRRLCKLVMQPIRDHLNRPITILSGYRPEYVNRLVGGSKTSEHMQARAADFIVSGLRPYQVAKELEAFLSTLPYNQFIHEFGRWTHVSVAAVGQKPLRQIITATKTPGHKTRYLPGLVDVLR